MTRHRHTTRTLKLALFAGTMLAAPILAGPLLTAPALAADSCSGLLYGSDLIGRTYNVKSGRIAYAGSVTDVQLFDLKCSVTQTGVIYGASYSYPKTLSETTIGTDTAAANMSSAQTYTEVNNNFGVDLGVDGVSSTFGGEIDVSFAASSTHSLATSYYHGGAGSVVQSYRLALSPTTSLRDLLIPSVKSDIDSMDPTALVNKYGTHFLRSAIFGGTWKFTQSMSSAQTTDTQSASAAIDAHYEQYSAKASASTSTVSIETNTQTNAYFQSIGGDPSAISSGLSAWATTVPGKFGLIQFDSGTGTNSLLPLSVLAATAERKLTIEKAIQNYLNSSHFTFYNLKWDGAGTTEVSDGERHINLTDTAKIIVGLAFSVDDTDVKQLAAQTRDLNTGKTEWVDYTGSTNVNLDAYERKFSLESNGYGLAPVGYCLSSGKRVAGNIGFYYRQVKATADTAGYLNGDTKFASSEGSSCEKSYNPGNGATKVLVGIGLSVNKDGNVSAVYSRFAPLVHADLASGS